MLWNDYAQRQQDQNIFERLNEQTRATQDEATSPASAEESTVDAEAAARADEQEFVQLGSDTYQNNMHDFKSLHSINSECAAWLTIPGTSIDYPVMYTPNDPEKYLNRKISIPMFWIKPFTPADFNSRTICNVSTVLRAKWESS